MTKNLKGFPLDASGDPFYPECQNCKQRPSICDDPHEVCDYEFCDTIQELYAEDFE